jgi:hypothetical protein
MKLCKVLVGPIMADDQKLYHAGDRISLSEKDAKMFAEWKFVEVLEEKTDRSEKPAVVKATEVKA